MNRKIFHNPEIITTRDTEAFAPQCLEKGYFYYFPRDYTMAKFKLWAGLFSAVTYEISMSCRKFWLLTYQDMRFNNDKAQGSLLPVLEA